MTGLSKDSDPRLDVAEVQGVLESRHRVASLLSDDLHHGKLLRVASNKVEERQLVKVLGLLVARLHNLTDQLIAFAKQSRSNLPGGFPT